jgi:single-strand DNA-binding protein
MYQKVTIIGNLGRDPEMRYTPSGTAVTDFSVATNRKWTNKDGTPGEETAWFRCSAWGKTAETVNQYLTKGRQVFIEGRLNPDSATGGPRVYTRGDGTPGAQFEVTIERIQFLGGRGEGDVSDPSVSQQEPPAGGDEADIPF